MKTTITKEFVSEKWYVCFNQAERFLLEYGLDFVNFKIEKKTTSGKELYVATIEYGLGVRND